MAQLTNEQRGDLQQRVSDMLATLEEVDDALLRGDEDLDQISDDLQSVSDKLEQAKKFVEDII